MITANRRKATRGLARACKNTVSRTSAYLTKVLSSAMGRTCRRLDNAKAIVGNQASDQMVSLVEQLVDLVVVRQVPPVYSLCRSKAKKNQFLVEALHLGATGKVCGQSGRKRGLLPFAESDLRRRITLRGI